MVIERGQDPCTAAKNLKFSKQVVRRRLTRYQDTDTAINHARSSRPAAMPSDGHLAALEILLDVKREGLSRWLWSSRGQARQPRY